MMKSTINCFLVAWGFLLAAAKANPIFQIQVNVLHDRFPRDTAWALTKKGGNGIPLRWQTEGSITTPNAFVTQSVNVLPGRYRFDITDSWGDGTCCNAGYGYYNLFVNGEFLHGPGNFGSSDAKEFTITDNGLVIEHFVDDLVPVREYRLEAQYPPTGDQDETRIKVVQNNQNVAMFDRSPNIVPNQLRVETISLVPGESYRLVLVDKAKNGMPGGNARVSMYEDGAFKQYLAWINGSDFSHKGIQDFVVPLVTNSAGIAQATSRAGNLRGKAGAEGSEEQKEEESEEEGDGNE